MESTQIGRRIVFAGSSAHRRQDDRFEIDASSVKFEYGASEDSQASKVPLKATSVKFEYGASEEENILEVKPTSCPCSLS